MGRKMSKMISRKLGLMILLGASAVCLLSSCETGWPPGNSTGNEGLTQEELNVFENFRKLRGCPDRRKLGSSAREAIYSLAERESKSGREISRQLIAKLLGEPDKTETYREGAYETSLLRYNVTVTRGEEIFFIAVFVKDKFCGFDYGNEIHDRGIDLEHIDEIVIMP